MNKSSTYQVKNRREKKEKKIPEKLKQGFKWIDGDMCLWKPACVFLVPGSNVALSFVFQGFLLHSVGKDIYATHRLQVAEKASTS